MFFPPKATGLGSHFSLLVTLAFFLKTLKIFGESAHILISDLLFVQLRPGRTSAAQHHRNGH